MAPLNSFLQVKKRCFSLFELIDFYLNFISILFEFYLNLFQFCGLKTIVVITVGYIQQNE